MAETGDEHQLIRDSLAGDEAAYAALVGCHQQMIHALTYRMSGSLDDADDLAQETFIRAFHQLDTFRGGAKFSSWLYRIAMNACLNWRSRERRRSDIHNQWAGENLSPAPVGSGELSQRVQAALNRLPAKQRAAIVLIVHEGLNHAEAAHVLGCTEATVSWRVFAARSKLKRWLKAVPQAHE